MYCKLTVIALVIIPIIQCLQLSSDDLQNHFNLIEANLISKIESATAEIKSYSALFMDYYISKTRASLTKDLEAFSSSYWNELLALEIEAAEQNLDIVSCALYSVEHFNLLLNSSLVEFNNKLNEIIRYEEIKNNNTMTVFAGILQGLSELAVEVNQCSTEVCGTELNSELIQFYEAASNEIDDAVFTVLEYVTTEVPALLEGSTVDSEMLQEQLEHLITAVKACFD